MNKRPTDVSSLNEAIERLEAAGASKSGEFRDTVEKEYREVKKALENLKPYFEKIKSNVETEVKEAKNQVEDKVRQHPWYALGLIGMFAFIIGWMIGHRRD